MDYLNDVYQITQGQMCEIDSFCFKINGLGLMLDCLQDESFVNISNETVNAVGMVGQIIQDLSDDIRDITSKLERREAGEGKGDI